ncbi:MAG: hypothetical protein JHC93_06770 [Parachlamydiales bacterium]|nr:hypothetical protein [Parachlamydiales bacterium]
MSTPPESTNKTNKDALVWICNNLKVGKLNSHNLVVKKTAPLKVAFIVTNYLTSVKNAITGENDEQSKVIRIWVATGFVSVISAILCRSLKK